jgi:hypothetical protein
MCPQHGGKFNAIEGRNGLTCSDVCPWVSDRREKGVEELAEAPQDHQVSPFNLVAPVALPYRRTCPLSNVAMRWGCVPGDGACSWWKLAKATYPRRTYGTYAARLMGVTCLV